MKGARLLGLALPLCGFLSLASVARADILLVKRVSGDVRMTRPGEASAAVEVKAGDLPDSGTVFETGAKASLGLRYHPDLMTLDAPGGARLRVTRASTDSGAERLVTVSAGRVAGTVPPGGSRLRLEDAHASASARAGRLVFSTTEGSSTLLVLEGEAVVRNRATGAAHRVRAGGKAVSDARGTVVTRAGERELAASGFAVDRLEVDFWNPATEEFRTLEVEYERRP
ncbi:MAG: hypothetical protein K0Q91_2199 [Fibrobacteria bacterium]|jgi:hypothetical protein|nr:hypothetical protein [Fibrobacteria bacterium]